MEIKIEIPEFYEEKKLTEKFDIIKLVLPQLVGQIKYMEFLKPFLYGGKKV